MSKDETRAPSHWWEASAPTTVPYHLPQMLRKLEIGLQDMESSQLLKHVLRNKRQ